MTDAGDPSEKLSPQSADIIREMARLHGSTQEEISFPQRIVEQTTALLVRPASIFLFTASCVLWILLNLLSKWVIGYAPDPPPFPMLELTATVGSMLLVLLVLATQRREDELAELREQLNLQLAMLNERKTAKIIAMLIDPDHDKPGLSERVDRDAESMAKPADLHSIVSAIRSSHGGGG